MPGGKALSLSRRCCGDSRLVGSKPSTSISVDCGRAAEACPDDLRAALRICVWTWRTAFSTP